jgi:hypothetical protein
MVEEIAMKAQPTPWAPGRRQGGEPKYEWQTKNVQRLLPHKHAGYFDLQLKDLGGKWKKTFQWDAEQPIVGQRASTDPRPVR